MKKPTKTTVGDSAILEQVSIPLYKTKLFLVIGKSLVDARSALPILWFPDKNTIAIDHCCQAVTFYNQDTDAVALAFTAPIPMESLAHEVSHATGKMFEMIGEDKLPHGSEAFAYPCGWITGWVYKKLRKHGVELT